MNPLQAAGPATRAIAGDTRLVLILFGVVSLVMWMLVVWVALRRTGTLTGHQPWHTRGGTAWIIAGGLAIPIATFSWLFVMSTRTLSAFPIGGLTMARSHQPDVRIIGHQWWWEIEYPGPTPDALVRTANEVHIPAGRRLTIELISRDVIHSFWVPEIQGKVDLVPGMVNHLEVNASREGRYRGKCAEYCGPQHGHMAIIVSVDSSDEFEQWMRHQREPAIPPAGSAATRGAEIFASHQCAWCHTIRGSGALGAIGPDLTHLASRVAIAGNSFPNSADVLAVWVTHAQSLKPGAYMPNLPPLSDADEQALIAYLQSLK